MRTLRTVTIVAVVATFAPSPLVSGARTPTLVGIRAAHHKGFDRIVFEFSGPPPDVARARWTSETLRLDPSHENAHVQGRARISVLFRTAVAHDLVPPYESTILPHRRAYDLPNIAHLVLLGDVEGDVSFGIGLMKRTRFLRKTMLRQPSRFVIDVATDYRKARVRVFFIDRSAYVEGDGEILAPVMRTVPRGAKARSAMKRLYAGPTASELAAGLAFVDSGTTGTRDLRVNARGVARVTLRGPCDSGGAAVTVGDEIKATLRSRPAIDWVKILDRDGTTLYPKGRSDSLPACLQP